MTRGLPRRRAAKTAYILGEGDCDKAFLDYLCRLYVQRGGGITVRTDNAHGKGPEHIIDTAIRQTRNKAYDIKAVLLDTDLPWSPEVKAQAKGHKIILIPSKPCLEGLLLRICGLSVPSTCRECKASIAKKTGGKKLTDPGVYEALLSKIMLDGAQSNVGSLDRLLNFLGCKKVKRKLRKRRSTGGK